MQDFRCELNIPGSDDSAFKMDDGSTELDLAFRYGERAGSVMALLFLLVSPADTC